MENVDTCPSKGRTRGWKEKNKNGFNTTPAAAS